MENIDPIDPVDSVDPRGLQNLISLAKKGDNQAFSSLYLAYFKPIYKYIYFRIGDKTETEDLVQDVFLKAFNSLSKYSYSGKSFLAYLYTIARNTTIDHHRKKKTPVADEDQAINVIDPEDTPDREFEKRENAEIIRKKISKLSDSEREVIILRFINGLETAEVARQLGKSQEAIRKLQSRGLKNLKKQFNNINE
jgi:RNA polymerase sigma-70 factor (ECF subfamily)